MANKESENAKAVAKAVIEKVQKGGKVVMRNIIEKSGKYALSMSAHPGKITKTQSYQKEMRPVVNQLEELRQKTINALNGKRLPKERVGELNNLLKNLNHDIELLSGKPTERNENTLTQEQLDELINRRAKTNNASRQA